MAIVGRPNVGKSSLINYLLAEERCIVSPIAGTTRDSVDVHLTHDGASYVLIDTAGIRRKGAEHEAVDKFASIRTERAIDRADVCLLMLDAQTGITAQEKRIANAIEEAGKGCILLFNKWDLVKGYRMEHCLKGIDDEAPFLKHCPKLFISATTGRNVDKIFDLVKQVSADCNLRVTTHTLNKFISSALQKNHPPMMQGKRLRIYYMAQVAVAPPRFILFVNYPNLMTETYKKYLYNQFRESFGFLGVPITLYLRGKPKKEREERMEEKDEGRRMKDEEEDILPEEDFTDEENSELFDDEG
jgi:GTP-binding protein